MASCWSGRRGSNSLPPPWQGGALPDELRPHIRCIYPCTLPFVSQTGPPRKLANARFCGEEEKFQCLSQRSCFARLPDKRLTFRRGASDRNRTNDTGIFSPLLYRLSYRGAPDDDYYTRNSGFVKRKLQIFLKKIRLFLKKAFERGIL